MTVGVKMIIPYNGVLYGEKLAKIFSSIGTCFFFYFGKTFTFLEPKRIAILEKYFKAPKSPTRVAKQMSLLKRLSKGPFT